MVKTKVRISTVTCSYCGDEIYSRARHDYHSCRCQRTTVDGGFDYLRYGWNLKDAKPHVKIRYIAITRKELYDDWNTRQDRFGTISKKGA